MLSLVATFSSSSFRVFDENRKIARARVQGGMLRNSIFWTWYGCCIREFTIAMLAWTWSSRSASPCGLDRSTGGPIPTWGAPGTWWLPGEGESIFFRGVASGKLLLLQWTTYLYVNMGRTRLCCWKTKAKTEDMKFEGEYVGKKGSERGERGSEEWIWSKHTVHIYEFIKKEKGKNEWINKQTNK